MMNQATSAVLANSRPSPTKAIPNTSNLGISSFSATSAESGSNPLEKITINKKKTHKTKSYNKNKVKYKKIET